MDDRPLTEVFRSLGRIEAGVEELKERGEKRDQTIVGLTEQVQQNKHSANNAAQVASNGIEALGHKITGLSGQMGSLDKRVQSLEAPVRRAMQQRQNRNRLWVRVASVSSLTAVVVWAVFEPLYKVGVELLAKRWMGGG